MRHEASFRDPSGYIFLHEGEIYRQINELGGSDYDMLMAGGLYTSLSEKGWIIEHSEVEDPRVGSEAESDNHKIIKPRKVPYVSYPYEWSFNQLKDAALLTLRVAAHALEYGMSLKDASAYNIQFIGSRPIFIDTLSFETYRTGSPWIAYKQFCEHFLAPLALMSYSDIGLSRLLSSGINGIPLATAARLLPFRTKLRPGLYAHIHLHARSQEKFANSATEAPEILTDKNTRAISRSALRAILESLATTVSKLQWRRPKTEWGDYYDNTNYSGEAFRHKAFILSNLLESIPHPITRLHDLGANIGAFSTIASEYSAYVVSQDVDPVAVDNQYLARKRQSEDNILPLLQDLTSPSPAIGWRNRERADFVSRSRCDVVLALALIHHLAISNNLPLPEIAAFFADLAPYLIIEFVPKSDTQVRRLLTTRSDIFPHYSEEGFEQAFLQLFEVHSKQKIVGSERTLYLMLRK